MKADLNRILKKNGHLIVDGSMSTPLERKGADLNCKLWTARILAEEPELIKEVHKDYFRAGADCGITASYQASIPGLIENGFSTEEAEMIIKRSVELFLEARDEWWKEEGEAAGREYPLCLASVGPYGAYLADGSEYRGCYGITDDKLKEFHAERMKLLIEAGADMLMIETIPSLSEALIVSDMAEEMGIDYIVCFSARDGFRINEGDMIRDCAEALLKGRRHLKMIGVNCTKPEYIDSLIREIKKGSNLPVIVYPNSGEIYDPETKTWHGSPDMKGFDEYALSYFKNGAAAVGGCCTTMPSHIAQVLSAKRKFDSMGQPKKIEI